jgi:hypothetical protein
VKILGSLSSGAWLHKISSPVDRLFSFEKNKKTIEISKKSFEMTMCYVL